MPSLREVHRKKAVCVGCGKEILLNLHINYDDKFESAFSKKKFRKFIDRIVDTSFEDMQYEHSCDPQHYIIYKAIYL